MKKVVKRTFNPEDKVKCIRSQGTMEGTIIQEGDICTVVEERKGRVLLKEYPKSEGCIRANAFILHEAAVNPEDPKINKFFEKYKV